eukprot:tig00021462_g21580.t1
MKFARVRPLGAGGPPLGRDGPPPDESPNTAAPGPTADLASSLRGGGTWGWRLRFADGAREGRFEEQYAQRGRVRFRILFAIGALASAGDLGWAMSFPDSRTHSDVYLRGAILGWMALLCAASFTPFYARLRPRRAFTFTLTGLLTTYALFCARRASGPYWIASYPPYYDQLAPATAIAVYLFGHVPLRYSTGVLPFLAALSLAGDFVGAATAPPELRRRGLLVAVSIQVLLANLTALVIHAAVRYEAEARRSFLLTETVERVRESAVAHAAAANAALHNLLPESVIDAVQRDEWGRINRLHESATVVFVSAEAPAPEPEAPPGPGAEPAAAGGLSQRKLSGSAAFGPMQALMAALEGLAERHGVIKIKSMGTTFMGVAGVSFDEEEEEEAPRADEKDEDGANEGGSRPMPAAHALHHTEAAAAFALEAVQAARGLGFSVKAGLYEGAVVTGVIGCRLAFDVFGDACNLAQRMCLHGEEGRVQLSVSARDVIRGHAANDSPPLRFTAPRACLVKGRGPIATCFVERGTDADAHSEPTATSCTPGALESPLLESAPHGPGPSAEPPPVAAAVAASAADTVSLYSLAPDHRGSTESAGRALLLQQRARAAEGGGILALASPPAGPHDSSGRSRRRSSVASVEAAAVPGARGGAESPAWPWARRHSLTPSSAQPAYAPSAFLLARLPHPSPSPAPSHRHPQAPAGPPSAHSSPQLGPRSQRGAPVPPPLPQDQTPLKIPSAPPSAAPLKAPSAPPSGHALAPASGRAPLPRQWSASRFLVHSRTTTSSSLPRDEPPPARSPLLAPSSAPTSLGSPAGSEKALRAPGLHARTRSFFRLVRSRRRGSDPSGRGARLAAAGGRRWWRLSFADEDDEAAYERAADGGVDGGLRALAAWGCLHLLLFPALRHVAGGLAESPLADGTLVEYGARGAYALVFTAALALLAAARRDAGAGAPGERRARRLRSAALHLVAASAAAGPVVRYARDLVIEHTEPARLAPYSALSLVDADAVFSLVCVTALGILPFAHAALWAAVLVASSACTFFNETRAADVVPVWLALFSLAAGATGYLREAESRRSFALQARGRREAAKAAEAEGDARAMLALCLPRAVLRRLPRAGGLGEWPSAGLPDAAAWAEYESVAVLQSDIVGFSALTSRTDPHHLVSALNALFAGCDDIAERHGVQTLRTAGDAWVGAIGLESPAGRREVGALLRAAEEMLALYARTALAVRRGSGSGPAADAAETTAAAAALASRLEPPASSRLAQLSERWVKEAVPVRFGVGLGPARGAVIGVRQWTWELLGPAVNDAQEMESTGVPNRIHVTPTVASCAGPAFRFEPAPPAVGSGSGALLVLPSSPAGAAQAEGPPRAEASLNL